MTYDEIHAWLTRRGWRQSTRSDALWYHPDPRRAGTRYRLSSVMLRYDACTASGDWIRLRSGYLCRLELTEDDKMRGMAR